MGARPHPAGLSSRTGPLGHPATPSIERMISSDRDTRRGRDLRLWWGLRTGDTLMTCHGLCIELIIAPRS